MVLFTKQHSTFMSSETLSENKLTTISSLKASNDVDLVRSYLRDIGRVPLLSHEQEITLGRQVQEYMQVERAELEIIELTGDKPSIEELSKKLNLSTSTYSWTCLPRVISCSCDNNGTLPISRK